MTDTKLDAGIYSAALDERDALRAENEKAREQYEEQVEEIRRLEAQVAHALRSASAYREERDEARRRALTKDGAGTGSRLDRYVLAVYQRYHTNPVTDIVAEAVRFMALVDRVKS
jgi:multidrug resistance efflux pump